MNALVQTKCTCCHTHRHGGVNAKQLMPERRLTEYTCITSHDAMTRFFGAAAEVKKKMLFVRPDLSQLGHDHPKKSVPMVQQGREQIWIIETFGLSKFRLSRTGCSTQWMPEQRSQCGQQLHCDFTQ